MRHREGDPVHLHEDDPVDLRIADGPGLVPEPRSAAVNASSVPAVAIQVRIVPIAAAIQVAATRVQNEVASTPGSTSSAMCIATAWLVIASSATASQPIVVATAIRTGRIRMPKMAVTAAAATSCQGDEALRPGSRAGRRSAPGS